MGSSNWRWRTLAGRAGILAGALAGLLACSPEPKTGVPGTERNVLLILVDDLRPDLGSYGHPLVQSPNIDRLAEIGVRFERAYSQFPVCNPSRSSFLTGLRPSTLGVLNNRVDYRDRLPDVVSLPELFRGNGYFTAAFGKVFHGPNNESRWTHSEAWDLESSPVGRRRIFRSQERGEVSFAGEEILWAAAKGKGEKQMDGLVARETVAALEQAREGPFFVAAGFWRPHTPLIAPGRYFDLYPLGKLRPFLAPTSEQPPFVGTEAQAGVSEQEQLELLRAYFACISFVDAQVGVIFEALDRLDLWSSTVVVLLSDHGIHLGERDWWSKNVLSERATRVPLIIYSPELETGGKSSSALVELLSLYPTLVELAGVPGSPTVEGVSLRPLLEDPEMPWSAAAFSQSVRGDLSGDSVRTDRWRYTQWGDNLTGRELYDHEADPGELVNLAGDPEHQETRASLEALLRAQRARAVKR